MSRKAICTGSEYVASVMYAALPIQRRTLGAISIVDGNVCVNMWETAYALPVWRSTHGDRSCVLARRVQKWIFISLYILCLSAGTLTTLRKL